jgi:hypothetical protein
MGSLAVFVRSLTEAGRARIEPLATPWDQAHTFDPDSALDSQDQESLRELDELARAEAPAQPPEFRLSEARFAAAVLHGACRLLVERSAPATALDFAFAGGGPDPADPASLWSVDLCFRYLPSLHERAQRVSPEDSLVLALRKLCAEWPLSGVGVPGAGRAWLTSPAARAVRESACLRGLLVDRVLSAADPEAAQIDWISEELARAAGAYPELLPDVWNSRHG